MTTAADLTAGDSPTALHITLLKLLWNEKVFPFVPGRTFKGKDMKT